MMITTSTAAESNWNPYSARDEAEVDPGHEAEEAAEADPEAEDVHTAEADPEPGPEAAQDALEGPEVGPEVGPEALPNEKNNHTLEVGVQAEAAHDLTLEVEAADGRTPGRVQGNRC